MLRRAMVEELLRPLMGRVVEDAFPDCADVFQKRGQEQLRLLAKGAEIADLHSAEASPGDMAFGLSTAVMYAPMMWGAYKALKELWKDAKKLRPKSKSKINVVGRWQAIMIAEGLDPDVASRIASKFGSDLVEIAGKLSDRE